MENITNEKDHTFHCSYVINLIYKNEMFPMLIGIKYNINTVKSNLHGNLFSGFKHFEIIHMYFHLISLQRNACIFVKNTRLNFALGKYRYNLKIINFFKTNCV